MQNVLFFLFRLHGGGAERVVANLSMGLSERYNIKIAVFDESEQTYPYKGELIRIQLPFSKDTAGNKWWARAIRLLVLVYKLRKIKRQHKIDVAFSFAEQANIINILTKGRRKTIIGVRTLLSRHIFDASNVKVLRLLIRLLYNRAQQVIVPSKMVAEDLITHFQVMPQKVKVIYNYTDQEKINSLSDEEIEDPFLKLLFEQPVLLQVGRITVAKGQWLLLELMKRIKIQQPSWKLLIIGEPENGGELKAQLIELAGRLGLKLYDNAGGQQPSLDFDVYMLGFQANPFRYMKRSRMLLFPSVFEGFPNTVLEAMQCGLPVIVADCDAGPREILAPETSIKTKALAMELTGYGILCPPLRSTDIKSHVPAEIIEEWMKAITLLGNDETLRSRFTMNGHKRVKDFDRQSILQQWEDSIVAATS